MSEEGSALLPLALHTRLGAHGLDRIEAHQAFNQGGIALCAGAVGRLRQFFQLALNDKGVAQNNHHPDSQGD